MNSCLYECTVMHHRLAPKEHRFSYRIFLFSLDLDEIDEVARRVRGFSHGRRNLYDFRDDDHLNKVPGSLRKNVESFLAEEGICLPPGTRITLVTLPRVFGYIFNPVSFYFCFGHAGAPIASLVEVRNTFHEMKMYAVPKRQEDGAFRRRVTKNFYVSPFSPPDWEFDFKLRIPDERLEMHVDDWEKEKRTFLSVLTGRRVPLTSARLAWFTLKYPLITLKVIFLIHWHAFLLWMRGLPVFQKTDNVEQQVDVLRPHRSLRSGKS